MRKERKVSWTMKRGTPRIRGIDAWNLVRGLALGLRAGSWQQGGPRLLRSALQRPAPRRPCVYLRVSPRKVRLVVDLIRGRSVEQALNLLTFSPKAVAEPVSQLLRSAVANADTGGKYDLDKLVVRTAYVDEGSTWRRWLPRAMGRATRVRKRTSHVTLILGEAR